MMFRQKSDLIEAFRIGIDPIPDWFMDKVTNNKAILLSPTVGNHSPFEHRSDTYCILRNENGISSFVNHGQYIVNNQNRPIYSYEAEHFEKVYELIENSTTTFRKISKHFEAFKIGLDPNPEWFTEQVNAGIIILLHPILVGMPDGFHNLSEVYCLMKNKDDPEQNLMIEHGEYITKAFNIYSDETFNKLFENIEEPKNTCKMNDTNCGTWS